MNRENRKAVAPHLLRWGGTILAASWLGYYICSGMPQVSLEVFPRTIALQALTFALAVIYGAYLVIRRRLPGGSPLDWPLVLLLIAYLAATITSVDWRVSLESTLMVLMAVLVFYVLSDLAFLDARSLQRSLMLAGAAASVWALWNVAGDYADWLNFAKTVRGDFQLGDLIPPTVPKVHGVSDHPNILGMTLILIVPFYMVAAYRATYYWERLAWGAALLAAMWAIFLTLSRGAWIGGMAGAIVTIGAIVLTVRPWPEQALRRAALVDLLRRRQSMVLLAGGLLAAVVVGAGVILMATRWESRPEWLFRQSLSPRQDAFSAGAEMFRDHLLLGAGPSTYGLLYPEYSGEYITHAIHAHNGYLQAAVDMGLVGLAALAVLAGVLAWMLWRSYRRGSGAQRLLVVACGGALVGFAVHNLADAPNVWKAPLVALAAVLAIIARTYQTIDQADDPPVSAREPGGLSGRLWPPTMASLLRLAPRAMMAVAILALFVGWGRIDAAHYHYSESLGYLRDGQTLDAVREGRQAVDMDSDFAIYQLQLGLTEGLAFTRGGPETLLDRSIEHLRRGVELEPRSAIGYANLARMLVLADENEEAREAALEAVRLAGADPTVLLAAGTVLEDIGATQEAIETYGMAISRMASVADSDFWLRSQFRRDHYGEILDSSLLALNPCTKGDILIRSSTQAPELATQDIESLREDCILFVLGNTGDLEARVNLAEILMTLGEYDAAFDHLDFAVNRQPDMDRARTAMGKWYASQGDVERAREEWIMAAQLGEAEALVLLGDTYPPGQVPKDVVKRLEKLAPGTAGGARSYSIGIVYYRIKFARESPPTILVPGEWQEALPGEYEMMEEALQRWRAGE